MKVEADEVVCKSFRLVDDTGHPLAELSSADGEPRLWLRSKTGAFEVLVTVNERYALFMLGKVSGARVDLQVEASGSFVVLSDRKGCPNVSIAGDAPGIAISRDYQRSISMGPDEDGMPSIGLWRDGILVQELADSPPEEQDGA
ncbi:MAG: hypothetical protein JNM84_24125 [Planctomycetes bacterium]|nr:hypothetical protein [Planctomycetota bacterium]